MASTWRNRFSLSRIVSIRLQMSLGLLRRSAQTLVSEKGTSAGRLEDSESDSSLVTRHNCFDSSAWKEVDSRVAGINKTSIPPSSWNVLNILRRKGFQAYLVGGCVRDLLLKKIPKDFDVITSASLKEVKSQFRRAILVGRQFPICQVYISGSIIEVSSFDTTRRNAKERELTASSEMASVSDADSLMRWKNCLQRDFTINSLFYDPSTNTIYDYVDGIKDTLSSKVRTVIPAHLSFEEDCARILRGIRIAARLGLTFSKETAQAIRDLSSSVSTLNKSRLMMEMNSMMAYGAAVSSIRLLHKFNILEILLPIQAAYMSRQMTSDSGPLGCMLMKLLFFADQLLSADRPCECSLWLGLLSFHMTLLLHPQDSLVVWAFASLMYHGERKTALGFAKESHANAHVLFSPELKNCAVNDRDVKSLLEKVTHLASLVKSTVRAFVHPEALAEINSKFSRASSQRMVFVSPKMGKTVADIFNIPRDDATSKTTRGIDYRLLKKGDLDEVRFVLGKIIIDAMSSGMIEQVKEDDRASSSLYSLFR